MDNQQATKEELAWLAGIFDGEGTFTINTNNTQRGEKYSYAALAVVGNTEASMIANCIRIMDKMEISQYISFKDFTSNPIGSHKKDAWIIRIKRQASLKILIESILPYLVSKKPHAEIVLRFINRRLTFKNGAEFVRDENNKVISAINNNRYTADDVILFEQISKLNKKGPSSNGASETTRDPSSLFILSRMIQNRGLSVEQIINALKKDDDIVQSPSENLERPI